MATQSPDISTTVNPKGGYKDFDTRVQEVQNKLRGGFLALDRRAKEIQAEQRLKPTAPPSIEPPPINTSATLIDPPTGALMPEESPSAHLSKPSVPQGVRKWVGSLASAWKPKAEQVGGDIKEGVGTAWVAAAAGVEKLRAPRERVLSFLKSGAESYLDKFNPEGKDKKTWALGIVSGFGSVVAAAELGATLGATPIVRALFTTGLIHASSFIYNRFVHPLYVGRALDKSSFSSTAEWNEVRNEVLALERSLTAKKLGREAYISAYSQGVTELLNRRTLYYPNSLIARSEHTVPKLTKLATDYQKVNRTAKSLLAGMAVGSIAGLAEEVYIRGLVKIAGEPLGTAGEWIGEHLGGGQAAGVAQEITTIQPAPGIPTVEEGYLKAPPIPETVITETQPVIPEVVAPQPEIAALEQNPQFIEQKAAVIGRYLPVTDEVLGKALESRDLMLASLDTASLEAGQEAMQHKMESKLNEIAAATAKTVLSADPNASLADINAASEKAFADWLSSEAGSSELAETGLQDIASHLQVESALSDKVNVLLESSPELYQEVIVQPGDTLGKILNLTWTVADAPTMGANIAVNHEILTGAWEQTAVNYPDLLSDSPYPVSESEINELVERAEAGDELARRKLVKALHWIPNGSTKFRVLTQAGVQRVLQELAGGGGQQVSRLAA